MIELGVVVMLFEYCFVSVLVMKHLKFECRVFDELPLEMFYIER